MKNFVVIGAGFSGTVLAARLLQESGDMPIRVYLLNGSGRIARGMAYGTHSSQHLLNVPAGNMSAFDEYPDHFLNFARTIDPNISAGSFVSRHLYGDYLEWTLNEAERTAPASAELRRIYCQVTNIAETPSDEGAVVTLQNGETIFADRVVLALGHFPASNPTAVARQFYETDRFLNDPWDHTRLDAIPTRSPVLLIGTGLTAIDVAVTLLSRNPDREIIAMSRRGLLPQPHRHAARKPEGSGVQSIWGDANTVRAQFRRLRKYCEMLSKHGGDWREALALLRPVTSEIWIAYSEKERRRFLRHVQPYWDTHRHRLAPTVAEKFTSALSSGKVRVIAGRLLEIDNIKDRLSVTLQQRGTMEIRTEYPQYVINCTGPCSDPRQTKSKLIHQLLNDNMIKIDSLGLGIDVAPDCSIINSLGKKSKKIFYIGPWLRANYWEATAVPDLRVIASRLSNTLLAH